MSVGIGHTNLAKSHDDAPDRLSSTCDICLQVGIAVATLATACFITLAALHYFTVASALIASFTGLADIILITGLSCKKCVLETQPSNLPATSHQLVQIYAEQRVKTVLDNTLPPKPPIAPVIRPPNPLSAEEWDQRLEIAPSAGSNSCFSGYNLIEPTLPPAPTTIARKMLALPTFGNYEHHFQDLIYRPVMAVCLPSSQLPAFPKEIQELFQAAPEIELYFLIYDDSRTQCTKRNLVLHDMVIPEYDAAQKTKTNGLWYPIEVGLFAAQGVEKPADKKEMLAVGHLKTFHAHLHPCKKEGTAISPNTCILNLSPEAPLSSFYTAARFRGRSVAFYTLLIRNVQSPEGQLIQKAIDLKPLSTTLQALQAENSPCSAEVQKLFSFYP